jgi:hypothetical protein
VGCMTDTVSDFGIGRRKMNIVLTSERSKCIRDDLDCIWYWKV